MNSGRKTAKKKTTQVRHTALMPGTMSPCESCKEWMTGGSWKREREKSHYILVQVYHRFKWVRNETWHIKCYDEAGEPYGNYGEYVPPKSQSGVNSKLK